MDRAPSPETKAPESTAVRVALWRALHKQIDPPPHVIEDEMGLKLIAPPPDWPNRPDMNPLWTRRIRASIVARARFVEDLVEEKLKKGVSQYVILGAGLDTFVQRKPSLASRLHIFEIDRPGPQAWKRQRLNELGFGIPDHLNFVAVDFEGGVSWWDKLLSTGFDLKKPAVVASTGVSMYLTNEANKATLKQVATLAPGSHFAMTFLRPLPMVDPEDQTMAERSQKGAAASGTPFVSFYAPDTLLSMARDAGFKKSEHISAAMMIEKYFKNRPDGLRPSNGEELLLAST